MFNAYSFEKKLRDYEQLKQLRKEFLKRKEEQREKNERLSENYKKKVEAFIIQMNESPVKLHSYKGPQDFQYREDEPEKFLGDPQIYLKGYKHEKDRIRENIEKNSNLDFKPNQSTLNYDFRPRHIDREIHPQMRFTSKTSLERIEAFIKENTMTQVENIDFRVEAKKKSKGSIFQNYPTNLSIHEKRAYISQQIAKNLLPSLHFKTHFKGVMDVANNLLNTVQKPSKTKSSPDLSGKKLLSQSVIEETVKLPLIKKVSYIDEQDQNLDVGSKKRIDTTQDGFNISEVSKRILNTCQVTKKKKIKSKFDRTRLQEQANIFHPDYDASKNNDDP